MAWSGLARYCAYAMVLALAALALPHGQASAQVAAPRLNPITPEVLKAFNPATLPWSGPSRIGAALSYQSTTESIQNGITTLDSEGDGKFMGSARLVGETFAFSAETLEVDFTQTNNQATGTYNAVMLNLAGVMGDAFALGVGVQNNTILYERTVGAASLEAEYEGSLSQVGLTLKLGDSVFIGAAGGTESLQGRITLSTPATEVIEDIERGVSRVGLGYYNRDKEGGFHVELYREAKELGDFADTNLADQEEEDTAGLTFEFIFYNFLLGVERVTTEKSIASGITEEKGQTVLHMGWVPATGLAITATLFDTENTFPNSTKVENEEGTFIAVAWLF